jgi:tRNA uridine 5-carbamoylmethylation protein Kti12
VDPPPVSTPAVSPEPVSESTTASVPKEASALPPPVPPVAVQPQEPVQKNIQWQRSNFTLVDDTTLERIIEQIQSGEFLSPSPNVSWFGHKHSPHAQHNRRIFDTLKSATNRTMSFTSLGAQAGIPDKEKLKSYLREMDKQGLITIQKA